MTTPPIWESEDREIYRVTFDEDGDAYDRTRPVAPAYVFDELVELAGLVAGSRVVEIGPGTGQATRPLAQRGLGVLALEIGPNLAERARQNLAEFGDVEVLTTSFEAWSRSRGPAASTLAAVFACNSFRWTAHDIRIRSP